MRWKRPQAGFGPEYEHNPRAMQLREYTLKEFGEIFRGRTDPLEQTLLTEKLMFT